MRFDAGVVAAPHPVRLALLDELRPGAATRGHEEGLSANAVVERHLALDVLHFGQKVGARPVTTVLRIVAVVTTNLVRGARVDLGSGSGFRVDQVRGPRGQRLVKAQGLAHGWG